MAKGNHIRRKVTQGIVAVTGGVFSYAVDVSLWFAVYLAELSVPQSSVGQLWRAQRAADRFLEHVNHETIARGIAEARRRGFLKKGKPGRRSAWPEITEAGKRRLAAIVPVYDEKRVWDGRMHLVTYDIPEKRRDDRELLRDYLKRLGCGKLQDSVWLTPYNPIDTLRSFIEEQRLQGTVIISDMGKDGSIGEENILALVARVWKLDALNRRYREWLDEAKETGVDHWMAVRYLSILRDDPQLPFPLLPPGWKGEAAYEAVKEKILLLSPRPQKQ